MLLTYVVLNEGALRSMDINSFIDCSFDDQAVVENTAWTEVRQEAGYDVLVSEAKTLCLMLPARVMATVLTALNRSELL